MKSEPPKTVRKTVLILTLLLSILGFLPSCSSLSKVPLRHRSDHIDNKELGDSGQTPRFDAPQGLILDLTALYAADGDAPGGAKKAVFVTMSMHNNSEKALSFDWKRWWLRSDDGRRYSPSKMETYNEKTGKYEPAPTVIAPGQQQSMTLTIPTGSRLRIELIITLVFHWRFRLGDKQHSIATFFQAT